MYEQWEKETRKYYQEHCPDYIPPYSHPDEQNLQITPYQGPRRKEYPAQPFLNMEPQTTAQRRQEEIALGQYQKEKIK